MWLETIARGQFSTFTVGSGDQTHLFNTFTHWAISPAQPWFSKQGLHYSGTHPSEWVSWPTSPGDQPVFTSPALRLQVYDIMQAFYISSGDQTQVLMLAWCDANSWSSTWLHQESTKMQAPGHICEGFLINWIIWSQKTHLKSGPPHLLGATYKKKDERDLCSLPNALILPS